VQAHHWLTVHARTKADGYRPPAHWHELATIRQHVALPIIANGDIDSVATAAQCLQVSQCQDVMIGRGAVIRPDLVGQIRGTQDALTWPESSAMAIKVFRRDVPSGTATQYHPRRLC
jgi:tRNA-dihydrouridine synthase C